MSTRPFDVRVIVNRLQAEQPGFKGTIGVAADYEAVKSLADVRTPSLFVILAGEEGQEQPVGHAPRGAQVKTRQLAAVAFAVVIAARNYRDPQLGSAVTDDLATLIEATRGVLMGFVPDVDGARAIQWERGWVLDRNAEKTLWAELYSTQHSIGNR